MGLGPALRHQRHLASRAPRSLGQRFASPTFTSASSTYRPPSLQLDAEVEVEATSATSAIIAIDYTVSGKSAAANRTVQLQPGVNHVVLPIEIANPSLWYPAGYGAQPIYKFNVQLKAGKQVEDEATAKTGLRSIVLRREPDQWGRSFEFVVNGIPVFGKGADVIPFDSFPTRVTTQQYRQVLQSAVDANMNMVRHWGGGYYETDEFYDLCDELGIMIWQDFMFGNDWQPGTYDWKLNVAAEAAAAAANACATIPASSSGAATTKPKSHSPGRTATSSLPKSASRCGRTTSPHSAASSPPPSTATHPKRPTGPAHPAPTTKKLNDKYQSGDMHDWTVWHGRVPFTDYEKHNPRFMTEYGFQSFPEMRTVETFTVPEDRLNIFTPVMLAHQKNNAGNAIIRDYMLRDYPAAQGLRLVPLRQPGPAGRRHQDRRRASSPQSPAHHGLDLLAAQRLLARRLMVEPRLLRTLEGPALLRSPLLRARPRLAASGRRQRRGVHRLRQDFANGGYASRPHPQLRRSGAQRQVAAGDNQLRLSSKVYLTIPMLDITNLPNADLGKIFAVTDLLVDNKPISSNTLFFVPKKDMQLPEAKITSALTAVKPGEFYSLHLASPVLAKSVYVSFGNLDAKPADNYFDLLPGQVIDLPITSAASLDELQKNLKVISLTDAFGPHEAQVSAGN